MRFMNFKKGYYCKTLGAIFFYITGLSVILHTEKYTYIYRYLVLIRLTNYESNIDSEIALKQVR